MYGRTRAFFAILIAVTSAGCGTLVPGPRYRVTVDDFAFSGDGRGVFYLQSHSRFHVLLRRYREYGDLYLYDTGSRKHRLIARSDAFSVSPQGPYVLYSPRWGGRYSDREGAPDFHIFDYERGQKRGYRMPDGFDADYIEYGFARVDWEEDGSLTAYVNFRYAPGEKPRGWLKQFERPAGWRTRRWKVRINPKREAGTVSAVPCVANDIPGDSWEENRRRKYISADGDRELEFSKYDNHFDFNSTLAIVDRKTGRGQFIVKESLPVGLCQAAKYIISSAVFAPLNLLDHLL